MRRVSTRSCERRIAPCRRAVAAPLGPGLGGWRGRSSPSESPRSGSGGDARARASPHLSLPQMPRFYVTTPIYYVNSTPHIGHAYTTIAADIVVRHPRQRGAETFFLTGVDEHATNVARVAREQGLTPQDYADRIAVV